MVGARGRTQAKITPEPWPEQAGASRWRASAHPVGAIGVAAVTGQPSKADLRSLGG